LQFVLGYSPTEFGSALTAIAEGKVDLSPLITGRVGIEDVPQAFKDLGDPEQHAKILVMPK
jgi:threonine dehydrogenase-like Zn-dependent dehydrogenase